MKKILLLTCLALSNYTFSQDKKCDCLVKLTEREFKLRTMLKSKGAEDYHKIKPKSGKKYSTHRIINDSADSWYLKPYITDIPESKTISVKKSSQILCLVIQFNGADSIPLYSEPNKDSKILKYIYKSNQATSEFDKSQGFDANDQWFAGCKSNWVKINIAGAISGWIKKENYLSK